MTVCSVSSVLCFFLHGKETLWVQFACKSTEKTESRPRRAIDLELAGEMGGIVQLLWFPCDPVGVYCLGHDWQGTLSYKVALVIILFPFWFQDKSLHNRWIKDIPLFHCTVCLGGRCRHANKTYASMTVMSNFTHGHKIQHNRYRQSSSFPAGVLRCEAIRLCLITEPLFVWLNNNWLTIDSPMLKQIKLKLLYDSLYKPLPLVAQYKSIYLRACNKQHLR